MFRRNTAALDAWRSTGLTYLQSLAVTSAALGKCVKTDPKTQSKYAKHSHGQYYAQKADGNGGWDRVTTIPNSIDALKKSDAAAPVNH